MITFKAPKHQWNYYLAIEKDLENLSRYIEFADENKYTFSIELTHILLSASSEVDVIMKQLCSIIAPEKASNNINDYRTIVQNHLKSFIDERIAIDRHGMLFRPWENWASDQNPNWWKSYNNVKHERNKYFNEGNLQNTVNAVGALLITTVYYYKYVFSKDAGKKVDFKTTTYELQPSSSFLRIDADYYFHTIVG